MSPHLVDVSISYSSTPAPFGGVWERIIKAALRVTVGS